jgi:hypothetical protein
MKNFYEPFVGRNYRKNESLLLLSESAYAWEDGSPGPEHPRLNTVEYWIYDRFENHGTEGRYAVAITRALCGERNPSLERRKEEWEKVAYSIYIQRPLDGVKARPRRSDFKQANEAFLGLIERLRPGRVFITSITAWNNMPDTQVQKDDFVQAYRLADGQLVWCMAVPHPRASIFGSGWENMADRIKTFRAMQLPSA